MSSTTCSACQEQEGNVDVGCHHFYCALCLYHLGGHCREGCEPLEQIPMQDARDILEYAEKELEATETKATKKIAKIEEEFRSRIVDVKAGIDRRYSEVKEAETYIEALETRSRSMIRDYPTVEYVKVHLESRCKPLAREFWFFLKSRIGPDKKPIVLIEKESGWLGRVTSEEFVSNVAFEGIHERFGYARAPLSLSIIAKSKEMVAFECKGLANIIIVDLKTRTATESFASFPKTDLLFFIGGALTSCPMPSGFNDTAGNLAVRYHSDYYKFVIFDPAVGQLELAVSNVSKEHPVFCRNKELSSDFEVRASVKLRGGQTFTIPYID